MDRWRQVTRDVRDRGASAVEYGLMVAAITAVTVGAVFGFGSVVKSTMDQTSACIESRGTSAPYPNC